MSALVRVRPSVVWIGAGIGVMAAGILAGAVVSVFHLAVPGLIAEVGSSVSLVLGGAMVWLGASWRHDLDVTSFAAVRDAERARPRALEEPPPLQESAEEANVHVA